MQLNNKLNINQLYNYLISFLTGAVGAVVILLLHTQSTPAMQLVAVDTQKLIESQINSLNYLTELATEDELLAKAEVFSAALDDYLNNLRQHNIVVLHKNAVLSAVPDITPNLLQELGVSREQ